MTFCTETDCDNLASYGYEYNILLKCSFHRTNFMNKHKCNICNFTTKIQGEECVICKSEMIPSLQSSDLCVYDSADNKVEFTLSENEFGYKVKVHDNLENIARNAAMTATNIISQEYTKLKQLTIDYNDKVKSLDKIVLIRVLYSKTRFYSFCSLTDHYLVDNMYQQSKTLRPFTNKNIEALFARHKFKIENQKTILMKEYERTASMTGIKNEVCYDTIFIHKLI